MPIVIDNTPLDLLAGMGLETARYHQGREQQAADLEHRRTLFGEWLAQEQMRQRQQQWQQAYSLDRERFEQDRAAAQARADQDRARQAADGMVARWMLGGGQGVSFPSAPAPLQAPPSPFGVPQQAAPVSGVIDAGGSPVPPEVLEALGSASPELVRAVYAQQEQARQRQTAAAQAQATAAQETASASAAMEPGIQAGIRAGLITPAQAAVYAEMIRQNPGALGTIQQQLDQRHSAGHKARAEQQEQARRLALATRAMAIRDNPQATQEERNAAWITLRDLGMVNQLPSNITGRTVDEGAKERAKFALDTATSDLAEYMRIDKKSKEDNAAIQGLRALRDAARVAYARTLGEETPTLSAAELHRERDALRKAKVPEELIRRWYAIRSQSVPPQAPGGSDAEIEAFLREQMLRGVPMPEALAAARAQFGQKGAP